MASAEGQRQKPPLRVQPYCVGDYADDFAALSASAREIERAQVGYTFCVRTTAIYACPFYGADGELQTTKKRVVAHGTAFAYKMRASDTLLLTNQHVADWPAVTTERQQVENVPAGCKRISDALAIVDGESDEFARDDLPLSRVVSDPQLDVAVLAAHEKLPTMPWRIGRSAGLRTRNVVSVRGFPLGILKATNAGKVVSAFDHDTYKDWDHDDFVIDALLSQGNSGSPVLAVSCTTGAFELVGIYHAGYTSGSALNVVVGIEQVHELMTTLERTRAFAGERGESLFDLPLLEAEIRRDPLGKLAFPFASRVAEVRLRSDESLVFDVLPSNFPIDAQPVFAAESPAGSAVQAPFTRVWFGIESGLQAHVVGELDAEAQTQLVRIARALRTNAFLTARYRAGARGITTREAAEGVARIRKSANSAFAAQRGLERALADLGERFASAAGPQISFSEVLRFSVATAAANALSPAAVPPGTASATSAAPASPVSVEPSTLAGHDAPHGSGG